MRPALTLLRVGNQRRLLGAAFTTKVALIEADAQSAM
jgi:hypothetical protein